MGHSPSCLDEPLVPECKMSRPPWYGRFTGREYKGQLEWWAEPGLVDHLYRNKIYRVQMAQFREQDKFWLDPPVPDGTSVSGPFGKDVQYNKDWTKKADQPGTLADFRRKVMEGSSQYKQVAAHSDLSPEHPGIQVSPMLKYISHTPSRVLGTGTIFPTGVWWVGPRFWDKPINEGCISKGLAMAKYGAIFCLPYTLLEIKSIESVPRDRINWYTMLRRYVQIIPVPCTILFAWGVGICTSANLRRKDDLWNYWAASSAAGVTAATLKNTPYGFGVALTSLFLGVIYQYMRTSEQGVQFRAAHPRSDGVYSGPLSWKFVEQGDWPPPTTVY